MENLDLLLFPLLAVMSLLIIICFILCMVCFSKYGKLKGTSKTKELDERVDTLESIIISLHDSKNFSTDITAQQIVDNNALSKIGIVKFDAFDGMTGKYSFSAAFLNNFSNGIILTSLYGHETCNTYLRIITDGVSDTKLLSEEQEALDKALKSEV